MRLPLVVAVSVTVLAACGGEDETSTDGTSVAAAVEESGGSGDEAAPDPTGDPASEEDTADDDTSGGNDTSGEASTPGPGDAVGTLTGPDLDIVVVGACSFDSSDLTSADIAFADLRGIDPSGATWAVRFGLSGSDTRNTQLNVNGADVVARWSTPGLLSQSSDEGSYALDDTIGRLTASAVAEGGTYTVDVSCFER